MTKRCIIYGDGKNNKPMCAIAGGFNITRETVEKMCVHQGSRGPDNTGIEQIGKVIFGHNRLSIIDKSERSNQPVLYKPDMMVYNGEIYNSLIHKNKTYPSDTLSLADRMYFVDDDYDLEEELNLLQGMFAYAYFNGETSKIYLIRDRFGIKPLYFTRQKDFFAFASTPAALTYTKPNWSRSEKGFQEYLSLGATMLNSMFEGIEAVPPGHYVVFNCNDHSLQVKRWYYPKFIDNAYEKIEEKVNEAIERVKLSCDWPQVILLSGGIDSSLVASHYQGREAIHLASPEQEYAQKVADKFNIKLHNVHPANYSAEECLTDYITKSGDPTMAGLIPYITCKEISRLGYRVAITANGADELFFGYDRMKGEILDQRNHIHRYFPFSEDIIDDVYLKFSLLFTRHKLPSMQWFEICTYLMFDLNKTLDFASMCHSVEVRVPYLDHELVEAALSIPMEQHVAKYGNKTILKKMLLDMGFDFNFIHRPKVGFSLHHEPNDLQDLKNKAIKWYKSTNYPALPPESTPRQEAYHQMTVVGLYLWSRIYNLA